MSDCTVIEANTSTRHDGSVAFYVDGNVYALAAERIDRIRHSIDAEPAYRLLKAKLAGTIDGKPCYDHFSTLYSPHDSLDHHLAHALGAFHCSPFDEAAIVVLDGMGPTDVKDVFTSASVWEAHRGEIPRLLERIEAPYPCCDSFGHFFSAVTYYLGFGFYDAGHTMSLAAYGNPTTFASAMDTLISSGPSGLPRTDHDFIRFATALRFPSEFGYLVSADQYGALSRRFEELLGPPRQCDGSIDQRHFDIAAAAQQRLEQMLRYLLTKVHQRTRIANLCYSGGVALNCKANARVLLTSPFENVFIHPAPDDTGQSLGKLLHRLYHSLKDGCSWRCVDVFLGPKYSDDEIRSALASAGPALRATELSSNTVIARAAEALLAGGVIGWFQGRSEFGPRALGHRSILANATDPLSARRVSERFKKREWYRPFAPSVLESAAHRYFEVPTKCFHKSPFMQYAIRATDEGVEALPAVVHVDGTARVQTVKDGDGCYAELLAEIGRRTGHPVLLNTSFNRPGLPLVETPTDALEAFADSALDCLVIDNWYIVKNKGG